jgi:SAM-dependent methyltransferase
MSSEVRLSTLMGYVIPEGFSIGTKCSEERMSDEEVFEVISKAKSNFSRGQAQLGIILPNDIIRKEQINAASLSKGISWHTKRLIRTFEGKGVALDLGCGVGLSSIALIKKGWTVYALDKHKEVLDIFKSRISEVKAQLKPEEPALGKYAIINKDITDMSLKENLLDLVLAEDVLPYLSPDSLIPTIKKIYKALLPGGVFIGTLLINRELRNNEEVVLMASVCFLRAYSYTNPAFVTNIFRHVGFHMEACNFRNLFDSSHPAQLVSFVAKKLPS